MTKQEFIEELNGDLSLELRSIVQYVQHISLVKGAKYQQTLGELDRHVKQELDHALILSRQIEFLGGTPTNEVPGFETRSEPDAALAQDLELEERQLERYRARVGQAARLDLPDVAEALAPVLHETQDHIRELRSALDR